MFGMRSIFKGKKYDAQDVDYENEFELYTVDTTDLNTADVITSYADHWKDGERCHQPVLDIDIEHFYVPSSTPGHAHLYFNVDPPISWEQYSNLLDALADCGIIEKNYADVSKRKGYTAVRLPWVKKESVK